MKNKKIGFCSVLDELKAHNEEIKESSKNNASRNPNAYLAEILSRIDSGNGDLICFDTAGEALIFLSKQSEE